MEGIGEILYQDSAFCEDALLMLGCQMAVLHV